MSLLKLIALDADDLQVISGCCQDAVLRVGEMDYNPKEKRFVLALNRYAWEENKSQERHKAVLHFERVNRVQLQGIDRSQKDIVISLLAILFEPGEEPGGTIELVLAGDGGIRLDVECIEAKLSDMPAAWKASSKPSHDD